MFIALDFWQQDWERDFGLGEPKSSEGDVGSWEAFGPILREDDK